MASQQKQLDSLIDKVALLLSSMHSEAVEHMAAMGAMGLSKWTWRNLENEWQNLKIDEQ